MSTCVGNKKQLLAYGITLISIVFSPLAAASFIESTIGTAVVNDATAAYYNPAGLVLISEPQLIPIVTAARFRSRFNGQSTARINAITESGSSSSTTNYISPSFYFGMPASDRIFLGIATLTNVANREVDEGGVLRYIQAKNDVQDYNLVTAIGIKLNTIFSVGAGINFSYLKLDSDPITGFPGAIATDTESHNSSDGHGVSIDVGVLLKPYTGTVLGLNYHSLTAYCLSGQSTYIGPPYLSSPHYRSMVRSPARTTFSINQFLTPTFGLIGTLQRIQWSVTQNTNIYSLAALVGAQPSIINVSVPFNLHNTWLVTLGGHWQLSPQWLWRLVGTYNQSPGNGYYQLAVGDSMTVATSAQYTLNKQWSIDGGYAHAFIHDQGIHISNNRFLVDGTNSASRDAVSIKVTYRFA